MNLAVDILNNLLPVIYGITVCGYAYAFFADSTLARNYQTLLLSSTLILHFVYILLRTLLFGHPPITTTFEIMSVIAFSIAATYRLIEHRTGVKNTGLFILILSFFFQLSSSIFIQDLLEVRPILRSNLLGIHVTSAMLGFSAFAIAAMYGLLYLMLYHNLKSSHFGIIYERLPNLENLERMASAAIVSGFALLTLAIVMGLVWLPEVLDKTFYFDAKLVGTFFIWVLYGVGIVAKRMAGLQGRKVMILSIVGFLTSFFSMTIINAYFSGFHRFF